MELDFCLNIAWSKTLGSVTLRQVVTGLVSDSWVEGACHKNRRQRENWRFQRDEVEDMRLQYVIQNDEYFKMQIISEMIHLIFSNPFGLWEREIRENKKKWKKRTLVYGTMGMYFFFHTMFSVLSWSSCLHEFLWALWPQGPQKDFIK